MVDEVALAGWQRGERNEVEHAVGDNEDAMSGADFLEQRIPDGLAQLLAGRAVLSLVPRGVEAAAVGFGFGGIAHALDERLDIRGAAELKARDGAAVGMHDECRVPGGASVAELAWGRGNPFVVQVGDENRVGGKVRAQVGEVAGPLALIGAELGAALS